MVVPSMQEQEAYELGQRKFPFITLVSSDSSCGHSDLTSQEGLVVAKIMDNALCEPWRTIGLSMTAMLPPDEMVGKTLIDALKDYVPVNMSVFLSSAFFSIYFVSTFTLAFMSNLFYSLG